MVLKSYLPILLTLTMIQTAFCNLMHTGELIDPNRNQSQQTFISSHFQATHFVGTYQTLNATSNLSQYILSIYFLASSPPLIFTLPTNITDQNHKIRTYSENTFAKASNNIKRFSGTLLLIENQITIKIGINQIENNYQIYNCIYNLSQTAKKSKQQLKINITEQIVDGMFGYSSQQLVLLLQSQIGYVVKYIYFNFTSKNIPYIQYTSDCLLDDSIVNVSNNQAYLNKMQYDYYSNVIYLPFTKIIIGLYANFTLDSKGYYYYGEINGVSFSVDAKTKDQIAVSYENTILVLDSSKRDAVTGNWKVKFNITTDYDIESIKFAPFFNFVYINSVYIPSLKSKVIEQMKYNMNYNASTKQYEGQILGSVLYSSPFKSCLQIITSSQILLYDSNPWLSNYHSNANNVFFGYDFNYACQNCTCAKGFSLNANTSSCELAIQYGSGGGGSQSRNKPSYKFLLPNKSTSAPATTASSVQSYSLILQSLNEQSSFSQFCNYLSKSLTFVSMKITPQAFLSLVTLLDDLWYYKYHNTSYPEQAQFFMEKVDLINELRFMIKKKATDTQLQNSTHDEVQLFYGIFSNYQNTEKSSPTIIYIPNFQNTKYINYLHIQAQLTSNTNFPSQVYFINSTSDIYTNTLFLNFLIFVVLKIVHFGLYVLAQHFRKLEWLHHKVEMESKWWTLIVAILQPNLMRLVYYAFLQISIPFTFVFQNKIVLAAAILTLYITIFYALSFYCFTYTFELPSIQHHQQNINKILPTQNLIQKISNQHRQHTKNPSHILLTCTVQNSNSIKPYIFQTVCILIRKIIRSFINSYFISNYSLQITLLFCTDLFFVLYIFTNKKLFNNFLLFFLILIYHFTFAVFDGFFMLEQHLNVRQIVTNQLLNKFAFVTLSILTVTSLLVCLLLFSFIIKKCFIFVFHCCKRNKSQQIHMQQLQTSNQHEPINELVDKNNKNKTDNFILEKKSKDIQLIDSIQQHQKKLTQTKNTSKINLKYKKIHESKQQKNKKTLFIKSQEEKISFEE